MIDLQSLLSRNNSRNSTKIINNKKSQSGTETIIILASLLFIFLVILLVQQNSSTSVTGTIHEGQIRSSLKSISDAANLVYKQGYGAKTTITINLPEGIASTVINETNIGYRLDSGQAIYVNLPFAAIGSLPTNSGETKITVGSEGDYVFIYGGLFSARPGIILESMDKNQVSVKTINITNIVNESLFLNFTGSSFVATGISSINLAANQSIILNITITSSNTYGKYLSYLRIYGISASGDTQIMMLPIYLDVAQPSITGLNGTIEGSIGFIPSTYDFGTVVPGSEHSKTLIIYSGFNGSKTVNISFNPSYAAWFSFVNFTQPQVTNMTITLAAQDYQEVNVYLKTWTNTSEGNYSEYINANYDATTALALITLSRAHDLGPPWINFTNSTSLSAYMGNTVCISAKAYDDTGVMAVYMNYTDNNGVKYYVQMNDTNISCSGNASDNLYGAIINLTYPGNYTIKNISAIDFSNNIGYNNTPIIIKSRKKIYGDFPFNGTVLSDQNDACYNTHNTPENRVASNVSYIDSLYVRNAEDNYNTGGACTPWKPDYTEFRWPDLGVPSDANITNVQLTLRHIENYAWSVPVNPNDESQNYLHMVFCWNGTDYAAIEPYAYSPDNITWTTYVNYDISNCINDSTHANNARIKISYDDAFNVVPTANIKFDYVQLLVDTSDSYIIDLGHSSGDPISPTQFNTALNSTANTFGVDLANDGWDWQDSTYGSTSDYNLSFVKHLDPSNKSDGKSNGRIEIRVGGNNSGTALGVASGAWGINFNITPEMYNVISSGQGVAYLSFNYIVEDLYLTTGGLGQGGAWVKARFGNTDGMNYLGSTIDNTALGTLHYADSSPELWASVEPSSPTWGSAATGIGITTRSFSQDVTGYITKAGMYYIDFGGKVSWEGGSKANNETIGFYFDNIRLIIKY